MILFTSCNQFNQVEIVANHHCCFFARQRSRCQKFSCVFLVTVRHRCKKKKINTDLPCEKGAQSFVKTLDVITPRELVFTSEILGRQLEVSSPVNF